MAGAMPPYAASASLPSSDARKEIVVPQVVEVEQRERVVVAVGEDEGQDRRLGLVQVEHLGQKERCRTSGPTRAPAHPASR